MQDHNWTKRFNGAITICDRDGVILSMNDQAIQAFQDEGGEKLIGTNVLDCHPEPARTKVQELLRHRRTNVYTIEKRGIKKLIYQAPWYEGGKFAGLVELSLEVPFQMPHFVRKG